MNHAITIRDLLLVSGLGLAAVLIVGGCCVIMAEGMSDAPDEGNKATSTGCLWVLGGAFLMLLCLGPLL